MTVKAKFNVSRITDHGRGNKEVFLTASTGPGNEEWSQYTPSAEIRMLICNPGASDQFEVEKAYFLTFEAA